MSEKIIPLKELKEDKSKQLTFGIKYDGEEYGRYIPLGKTWNSDTEDRFHWSFYQTACDLFLATLIKAEKLKRGMNDIPIDSDEYRDICNKIIMELKKYYKEL